MDKVPPSNEAAIQKAAESLRENAINRLNLDISPSSNQINHDEPKSPALCRSTKRNEALVNCLVLSCIVCLSALVHPLDWRLSVGCLCAGLLMALGFLLAKKGNDYLSVVTFLLATGLGFFSMVQFGAKGPMIWVQSMPLIGIGAFGLTYTLFDKFDFKD